MMQPLLTYAEQVCTTELGEVGKLLPEFAKRGVKVLALSSNTTESHNGCVAPSRQHPAVQLCISAPTPCRLLPFRILQPSRSDPQLCELHSAGGSRTLRHTHQTARSTTPSLPISTRTLLRCESWCHCALNRLQSSCSCSWSYQAAISLRSPSAVADMAALTLTRRTRPACQ